MLIVHACGSQAMNPGGITLLGSPWSPPQWMKASPGKQGQEANTLDLSTPGAADAWVQYMVKCADLLLFYIYIYIYIGSQPRPFLVSSSVPVRCSSGDPTLCALRKAMPAVPPLLSTSTLQSRSQLRHIRPLSPCSPAAMGTSLICRPAGIRAQRDHGSRDDYAE